MLYQKSVPCVFKGVGIKTVVAVSQKTVVNVIIATYLVKIVSNLFVFTLNANVLRSRKRK